MHDDARGQRLGAGLGAGLGRRPCRGLGLRFGQRFGAGLGRAVRPLLICVALLGPGAAAAQADPSGAPAEVLPAAVTTAEPSAAPQLSQPRLGPETGFPLPRYVSLRAGEANARRGPSRSHRIDWVFTRRGLPVMVVAEHGHWRRVVDRDGAGGWMHYSLLSGERTAIVEVDMLPLRARPGEGTIRAYAELGVTGRLVACEPGFCLIETGGYRGWVEASGIWGVDPGEVFD